MNIDEIVRTYYNRIDKKIIYMFVSSIIVGFLSHGFMLFNKFSFHDDSYSLFTVGATFTSGRYMLYEVSHFIQQYVGGLYSTPLYEGLLTIIFIAISSIIIVLILDIESIFIACLVAMYMESFPVVAGMLGFMFTSCYYGLAILMTTLGCFFICKNNDVLKFIVGILLIANAIGIYQAYIPIMTSIFLMSFIKYFFQKAQSWEKGVLESKKVAFEFLAREGYYCLASVLVVLTYFLINKIELIRYNQVLDKYKGIDKMGIMSLAQFFNRVKSTLLLFYKPSKNLFPGPIYKIYIILLVLLLISAYICFAKYWSCVQSVLFVCFLAFLFPIAFNFIYIMLEEPLLVSTLQMYGYCMVGVCSLFFYDLLQGELKNNIIVKSYYFFLPVLIIFNIFFNVRLDNIVYLKADILTTRVYAYCNQLVSSIKNCDGYKDEMPVCYIKNGKLDDTTIKELPVWDSFYVHPYADTEYIINYSWKGILIYWLGFNPAEVDEDDFSRKDEIRKMPCYPDDGSIKVIDGTVVVKLSDEL